MRKRRPLRRQVGIGKASASESLLTCRKVELTSEPGCQGSPGMSLAGARLLARRCPAYRRREPGLRPSYGTGEGGSGYVSAGERGDRERPGRSEAVRD